MLDEVASIHNAGRALLESSDGTSENDVVAEASSAADKNGIASGGLDDFVVVGDVVGGTRLENFGTEFDGLADEARDFIGVPIAWREALLFSYKRHRATQTASFLDKQ
jgi:hypothetical protein